MIKITNGVNVFEVTRGAFEGIYSRQGYVVVEEHKQATEQPKAPEKTEDELFVESIVEKPISQWSAAEVKRFAAINEIDITGTKNANEAKEIIKEFLEVSEDEETEDEE